jgi:hypothetical protein
MSQNVFDREKALKDGNLAKGLIWLGNENGADKFLWCKVSILAGPNNFGQYVVQRVRDGWYATTDKLRNLKTEDKKQILANSSVS